MNRCSKIKKTTLFIAAGALLAGAGALFHTESQAERAFPPMTQRAEMTFVQLPDVLINGTPERLPHNVRVRDERNATVVPGRVNGQKAVVNYLRDRGGTIREVWILSAQEAATPLRPQPAPYKPASAASGATASFLN